jgi:DNA repair exonuclease SbcCD nuclease subunit
MVRFLHTGDWQLGMTRHFLAPEAQARFTQDRFDAVRRLLGLARSEGCAFVVVCGDVFESNQVDRRTVVRALEAMAEARLPVFLLPGNHDPLDAASIYTSRAFVEHRPEHVHVLTGSEPVAVGPGVEVVGAPWFTKRPLEDLVAAACGALPAAEGVIRVVVGHGALDFVTPERDDPERIVWENVQRFLDAGQVHYVALGDRHSLTRCDKAGRVWYAGTPEPTAHDELDPGKVLLVDVDAKGVRTEAHDIARWRFEKREVELYGPDDVAALEAWLADGRGKERTILRLALTGTLRLRAKVRLDEVVEEARDVYAAIDVWERQRDLTIVPDDEDFSDLGLTGFADATVEVLREAATGDDERGHDARNALALLVRLARRHA